MPAPADPRGSPTQRTARSLLPVVVAAALGFLAGDAARPPHAQWLVRLGVGAIDGYQSLVSPALSASGLVRCRYTPTCSAYAREALRRFGPMRGAAFAGGRLLRCHPWARGGSDPLPRVEVEGRGWKGAGRTLHLPPTTYHPSPTGRRTPAPRR